MQAFGALEDGDRNPPRLLERGLDLGVPATLRHTDRPALEQHRLLDPLLFRPVLVLVADVYLADDVVLVADVLELVGEIAERELVVLWRTPEPVAGRRAALAHERLDLAVGEAERHVEGAPLAEAQRHAEA